MSAQFLPRPLEEVQETFHHYMSIGKFTQPEQLPKSFQPKQRKAGHSLGARSAKVSPRDDPIVVQDDASLRAKSCASRSLLKLLGSDPRHTKQLQSKAGHSLPSFSTPKARSAS